VTVGTPMSSIEGGPRLRHSCLSTVRPAVRVITSYTPSPEAPLLVEGASLEPRTVTATLTDGTFEVRTVLMVRGWVLTGA
jgi:hypothetical protein